MKLYVLSDLHVEFRPFTPNPVAVAAADVVVLAGDIYPGVEGIVWARKSFSDKPIIYVAGNHEFYGRHWDKLLDQLRETAAKQSVHFLENDAVTIEGVRFLGATLWTDFDYFGRSRRSQCMREVETFLNDYDTIKAETLKPERVATILGMHDGKKGPVRWSRKLTAAHTLERHQASRAWLASELQKEGCGDPGKTVVVTHHYPNKLSTAPRFIDDPVTAGFGSVLPPDMLLNAGLWIHGHTHDSCDYRIGDSKPSVRVICNPRGYPLGQHTTEFENASFDDQLLIEV